MMTKQELISMFIRNHRETMDYINQLDEQQFTSGFNSKWTAGQHLKHILLTIVPFPGALASKTVLLEKFGVVDRPTWNYETVLENYAKTSLKAPDQFLPGDEITPDAKGELNAELLEVLENIHSELNKYTEEELDTLVLPHPLLGKLTIREMFYLMGYHPLHHQKQLESMLAEMKGETQSGNRL